MDDCCEIRPVHAQQRRVLRVVLWINLGMFVAELVAGLIAHSTALLADSVDMLGDAIVYGFSLYVIANAGVLLAALGVGWSGSAWPDILVGLGIAALFASSAAGVIRDALAASQPST